MVHFKSSSHALFAISLILVFNAFATEEIVGKVVSVRDGDSFTLITADKKEQEVRLEGIDAPELKQAFGDKSKHALSDLVLGKTAKVVVTGSDRYGRKIGDVHIETTWVNLELVKTGFAWHFEKYNKDQRLKDAQADARKSRAGLWKDDAPTSPWDWRAANKVTEIQ